MTLCYPARQGWLACKHPAGESKRAENRGSGCPDRRIVRLPPEAGGSTTTQTGGVGNMEEFEGGFLRSVIIGLVLALGFSIVFVWFR